MSDGLPQITMGFSGGAPVVTVDQATVRDAAELVRLAPGLADPKWVRAYARTVNHLAQGDNFEPIMDPAAFQARYMARHDAEDPAEPPAPGKIRLHNYGLPDFSAIAAPAYEEGTLVFFAEHLTLGLPYRVTVAPGSAPSYKPARLLPKAG